MPDYIIGYSTPTFIIKVRDYLGNIITVDMIELPYTNETGLIESNTEEGIRHVLLKNREIVKQPKGIRKTFTLHYDEYLDSDLAEKIRLVVDYGLKAHLGYELHLLPRSDTPSYRFVVTYTGEAVELGIHKGGQLSMGNRLPILTFETTLLQPSLGWIKKESVPNVSSTRHPLIGVYEPI